MTLVQRDRLLDGRRLRAEDGHERLARVFGALDVRVTRRAYVLDEIGVCALERPRRERDEIVDRDVEPHGAAKPERHLAFAEVHVRARRRRDLVGDAPRERDVRVAGRGACASEPLQERSRERAARPRCSRLGAGRERAHGLRRARQDVLHERVDDRAIGRATVASTSSQVLDVRRQKPWHRLGPQRQRLGVLGTFDVEQRMLHGAVRQHGELEVRGIGVVLDPARVMSRDAQHRIEIEREVVIEHSPGGLANHVERRRRPERRVQTPELVVRRRSRRLGEPRRVLAQSERRRVLGVRAHVSLEETVAQRDHRAAERLRRVPRPPGEIGCCRTTSMSGQPWSPGGSDLDPRGPAPRSEPIVQK